MRPRVPRAVCGADPTATTPRDRARTQTTPVAPLNMTSAALRSLTRRLPRVGTPLRGIRGAKRSISDWRRDWRDRCESAEMAGSCRFRTTGRTTGALGLSHGERATNNGHEAQSTAGRDRCEHRPMAATCFGRSAARDLSYSRSRHASESRPPSRRRPLLVERVKRHIPPSASNQRLAAQDPLELTAKSGSHGARSDVRRFDVELQPGKPHVHHRPVAQESHGPLGDVAASSRWSNRADDLRNEVVSIHCDEPAGAEHLIVVSGRYCKRCSLLG